MKSLLLGAALLLLSSWNAAAQTGFYLPSSVPSSGQDEFRAADGTSCRSTMDGTKRVEVGTFTSAAQSPGYGYGYSYVNPGVTAGRALQGNVGLYGRVSVSLDARPDRMDCNKLFELELERRRLEVEIMKRSLISADRELDQQKRRMDSPGVDRDATGSLVKDTEDMPLRLSKAEPMTRQNRRTKLRSARDQFAPL